MALKLPPGNYIKKRKREANESWVRSFNGDPVVTAEAISRLLLKTQRIVLKPEGKDGFFDLEKVSTLGPWSKYLLTKGAKSMQRTISIMADKAEPPRKKNSSRLHPMEVLHFIYWRFPSTVRGDFTVLHTLTRKELELPPVSAINPSA